MRDIFSNLIIAFYILELQLLFPLFAYVCTPVAIILLYFRKLYGKNSSYNFSHENKPTSFAPRLKILFIFTDNPTIKIGMGQHHPTIAFVISYLLLAGVD